MKKIFSMLAAVLFAGSMMATEVVFTNADFAGQGTANTGSEVTATKDGVTFTYSKGYSADESLRCYAHGELTISAESTIEKINFTTTGGKTGGLDAEVTVGATTYSVADLASQARFTEIKVTLGGEAPSVATPVISGEAEFTESTQVTITCATEGAAIYFSLNGDDPTTNSLPYDEPFTLNESATVKAVAYDIESNQYSAVASKTFTKKEPLVAISCAEVYNKAKGDELALNNVVVTYANGKNVFVKDETGSMLLYLTQNTTWEAGNILSGVQGTLDIYNGLYEVKMTEAQVTAVQPGQGEVPAPVEFNAAPVAADMNKYVVLKNVTVSAETFPSNKNMNATIGDETFVLRNQFNADAAFDTTKVYDITGVVAVYNATVQVYFINATEAKQPADAWTEIVFNKAVPAADLPADASFEFDGLHVAITDSENKMSIDGNKANFGTADAYTQYAFRLKTGGKSLNGTKQNFITINVPEDGELRLAVRSGNSSDETRTLVLVQDNDTVYNAIVKDADAIEVKVTDSTTAKVFPYVKVPVKAGNINVSYPVNGLNFYSFAFHANIVPPTPEHTYTVAGAPAALFGKEWNASFEENDMVKTPLDTYLWGKDSVALAPGKVEFKVVEDHAWAHAWPEDNYVLNIDSAGIYNVSIVFNPNADVKVSAVAIKIADAEVLPTVIMHGTFFGNWADTEEFLVSEDKKSAAITLLLDEGTYEFGVKLNGVWRANGANITREANSANLATGSGNMHITADVAGAYEFVYTFASERLDVIYPAEPQEGVDVTITEGVRFVDYVDVEGWWQIMAENDKFIVSVSNVSTTQLEGVYTIADLDKDFTYLGLINANDTAFVSFIDGSVALTLNEQAQTVTVAGTLLGNDSIKYNLNLVFAEPKAKDTVNVNITDGKILDQYAAYDLYGLYGYDENNVFVILSLWADNGLQGEFTETDLDFNNLGSGVIDQDGSADIYKAAITVTPGNGGDYSVTATLLCYNNKLYNVTMYIPASQGIEDVDAAVKAVKRIINDQLIIEKNGRLYNATGAVVR